MKTADFLGLVRDQAQHRLSDSLKDFKYRMQGGLIKFYYGEATIHYEVWLLRRTGRIEVGLHFEGEAEDNSRWLSYIGSRYRDIVAALGPGLEAEQWTSSWTRLHETLPFMPLDETLAHRIASRLARMIQVLQPIIEEQRLLRAI